MSKRREFLRLGCGLTAAAIGYMIFGCGPCTEYMLRESKEEKDPDLIERLVYTGEVGSGSDNQNAGKIELTAKKGYFEERPCLDLLLRIESAEMLQSSFSGEFKSKCDFDMNSLYANKDEVIKLFGNEIKSDKEFSYGWGNKKIKDRVSAIYYAMKLIRNMDAGEERKFNFATNSMLEPEDLNRDKYSCTIKVERGEIIYKGKKLPVKKVILETDNRFDLYFGQVPGRDVKVPLRVDSTISLGPFELKVMATLDEENSVFDEKWMIYSKKGF